MAQQLQGLIYGDQGLPDGTVQYLDTEGTGMPVICMNLSTYRALLPNESALQRLTDFCLDTAPVDPFPIPLGVLESEEAREVRASLALIQPELSDHCIYPPCMQDAVVVHEGGFSLCQRHADLLSEWDTLIA